MVNENQEGTEAIPWRTYAWAIATFCWLTLSFFGLTNLYAETPPRAPSQASLAKPIGSPVVFADETLFFLYDKFGEFTPQDRARSLRDRLDLLSRSSEVPLDEIRISDVEHYTILSAGDFLIMAVTDGDATPLGGTRQEIAKDYAKKIQVAVTKTREEVTLKALLIDTALALLDTAIFVALLLFFHRAFPKIYAKINNWCGTVIRPIKVQRIELLSTGQIAAILTGITKAIRIVAVLVLFYIYLTSVLSIFPWTRSISATLFQAVLSTLTTIGHAFATYIPNVISIIVIMVVTRYIIKLIGLLFTGIGRGAITIEGFHADWAEPTYKVVRFLVIVFAAIASFPYIPGSQSEGFRGISVFLGLLISLGSAAAIGNVIAGIVLTYMRPFHVGDRVRIADAFGDVTEKTLLVTRVRTIKNVDITIPNALVLGSHIVNFSSSASDHPPLILHTSVTIGYDAPWRKVHELLIAAARTTEHILTKPEPFVLQTSLNDFYVTYEVNAYTDQPNLMTRITAELHQNVQDKFNEAGVEIMSPHYTQVRDGNRTAVPDQYLPKNYQAPGLRIWPLNSAPSHQDGSRSHPLD